MKKGKGKVMANRIRAVGLLVLLVLGATSLIAQPEYETFIYFYTDATYTTRCGYHYLGCQGSWYSGCQTEWEITEYGAACDSPCGGDGC